MANPEYLEKYKKESEDRHKEYLAWLNENQEEFAERQKAYLKYHSEFEKTLGKL